MITSEICDNIIILHSLRNGLKSLLTSHFVWWHVALRRLRNARIWDQTKILMVNKSRFKMLMVRCAVINHVLTRVAIKLIFQPYIWWYAYLNDIWTQISQKELSTRATCLFIPLAKKQASGEPCRWATVRLP